MGMGQQQMGMGMGMGQQQMGMGMGMGMGGQMSTMSTGNVDLVLLKQKLIQELSAYNILVDKEMIISIIKNSDYIKQLRRSFHNPTIFQAGIQDLIDGVQDKLLKIPEKWKTEFTQVENTATLNELFYDMLKKYKNSVGQGGEMTSTDLYSLMQLNSSATNCGASQPPPHQSSNKPSWASRIKNAVTRKNNSSGSSGSSGPSGPSVFSRMSTSAKNATQKLKEKLRPKTAEEKATAEAAKVQKKADAEAAKAKKKADAEAAKVQEKEAYDKKKAELGNKIIKGEATMGERIQHSAMVKRDAAAAAAKAVGAKVSNAASTAGKVVSGAAKAVKTSVSNAASTAGNALKTAAVKVANPVGTYNEYQTNRSIAQQENAERAAARAEARAAAPQRQTARETAKALANSAKQGAKNAAKTTRKAARSVVTTVQQLPGAIKSRVSAGVDNFQKNMAERVVNYNQSRQDNSDRKAQPAAPSAPASVQVGGGGSSGASHNRTRYISDIKHNRKRLYDREREIIQSIRNFENNNNNNNNNNRKESRHHKTRKLRNILMRR